MRFIASHRAEGEQTDGAKVRAVDRISDLVYSVQSVPL
jgi:hypothetical protein